MYSTPGGSGKLPNRSVRRKPKISASNLLRFGPKIRYLGQECHIFHTVTSQICDNPQLWSKNLWS